jgi:chromosome segregation ATPase
LKATIGKALGELSERLASESAKFRSLQAAIASKERELQELYGIEKSAATLAALIESQNRRQQQFEDEIAGTREELSKGIESSRVEWEQEKKQHEAEVRERDNNEKKTRERDKEEFTYAFKREQQSLRDQLADEKKKLEQEIQTQRETGLRDLTEREKVLAVKEAESATLLARVAAFPKELETAIAKAVQDATERIKLEAKNREELLRKDFEGQKNVLTTKVESFEKTLKEQAEQNAKLARQLETAYQKVQEIAEKAIEGSAQSKALSDLQKVLAEQGRKPSAEKA